MLATIPQALDALRAGHMIIVVDDEHRENEGDLVMAAEHATPEAINFMTKHGRGLICVAMTPERVQALRLPMMVPEEDNTTPYHTAFTVSVDAREGITTGISAFDRARTIRLLADPSTRPDDLVRPGHVFPLRAREGGVLVRPGHTEAAVDLMRLAGLQPAGVLCEILAEDGTMARWPELTAFATTHNLLIVRIADLVTYRRERESTLECRARATLPTPYGPFQVLAYIDRTTGRDHLALVRGQVTGAPPPLVRIHSECLTGDVFSSQRCDCGPQLTKALQLIAAEGRGVVIYLRQEGRGIGLCNKVRAYALQDQGMDTVEANMHLGFPPDARDYIMAARILHDLGIQRVRLMTNNPQKVRDLERWGIEVVERVPLVIPPTAHNWRYLHTKKEKLGHLLEVSPPEEDRE